MQKETRFERDSQEQTEVGGGRRRAVRVGAGRQAQSTAPASARAVAGEATGEALAVWPGARDRPGGSAAAVVWQGVSPQRGAGDGGRADAAERAAGLVAQLVALAAAWSGAARIPRDRRGLRCVCDTKCCYVFRHTRKMLQYKENAACP